MKKQLFVCFALCAVLGLRAQNNIEFLVNLQGETGAFIGHIKICKPTAPDPYMIRMRWPMVNTLNINGVTVNQLNNGWWELIFDGPFWPHNLVTGCSNIAVSGTYDPPMAFPPYSVDNENDTLPLVVNDPSFLPGSANAIPVEYHFSPDCFLYSPDKLCLGQAQLRAWRWPVDANIPANRKEWALAIAHSHRYRNNLMGGEYMDINYAFSIGLIESRLGSDPGINPHPVDDWPLDEYTDTFGNTNAIPNPGSGGLFQVKPQGYTQLETFYPDIFGQIGYGSVITGSRFVTECWAHTFFDQTSMLLLDKHGDFCTDNIYEFFNNSNDPYAAEMVLAYMYNQGAWGFYGQVGNSMLNTNRNAHMNQVDLAQYVAENNGCSEGTAYIERTRNYLMQLGNNMNPAGGAALHCNDTRINWGEDPIDPAQPDYYEWNGCYNEPIEWSDLNSYLNEVFVVFNTADQNQVRSRTQNAFNALNGGAAVLFEDLGPVIDTMLMALPVYTGIQGMTGQYEPASESCDQPAASIVSYDAICPGESGEVLVTMYGTPPFSYTIEGPTGEIYSASNVNVSTAYFTVTQPGEYVLINFSDASGREPSTTCDVNRTVIENAGSATAVWNRDNVNGNCASGDLALNLTGSGPWEIRYTVDGLNETTVIIPNGAISPYVVLTDAPEATYALTYMNAGGCESDLDEEITFCSSCTAATSSQVSGTENEICANETTTLSVVTDQPSYDLQWLLDGQEINGATTSTYQATLSGEYTVRVTDPNDASCSYTSNGSEVFTLTVNPEVIPALTISASNNSICEGENVDFNVSNLVGGDGNEVYDWLVNGQSTGFSTYGYSSNALQNGDEISLEVSNLVACATIDPVVSNEIQITVSDAVVPEVTIAADQTIVCEGDQVSFSVDQLIGGDGNQIYEWRVNGTSVGTQSSFNTTSLSSADLVSLLVSNLSACATNNEVLSNEVSIEVNQAETPYIEINATSTTICDGDQVTFTITNQAHQGVNPTYEWFLNGQASGASDSFSRNDLEDGDVVFVQMQSSETCISDNTTSSNTIVINVTQSVDPSVSFESDNTTICEGEDFEFSLTGGSGLGESAVYTWLVNGVALHTGTSFSYASAQDNGEIVLRATGLSSCATTDEVFSDPLTLTVIEPVTPEVTIAANATNICEGDEVVIRIGSSLHTGASPTYMWFLNGSQVSSETEYRNDQLQDNDEVYLQLNTDLNCVSSNSAVSNTVEINVLESITPRITIATASSTACVGEEMGFEVFGMNGEGSGPIINWSVNGNTVGTGLTFNSSTLNDGDIVMANLESSEGCLAVNSVSSNQIAVTISENFTPSIALDVQNACVGQNVVINAAVENASQSDLAWSINGIQQSETGTSLTVEHARNGQVIELEASPRLSCGIASTEQVILSLSEIVLPEISASETEICEGDDPIILSVNWNGQTTWYLNGNPITENVLQYEVQVSGHYHVQVVDELCGAFDLDPIEIIVRERPQVDAGPNQEVERGNSVILEGVVSDADFFSWSPVNYLDQAQVFDPIFYADENVMNGFYTFYLRAEKDGCVAYDSTQVEVFGGDLVIYNTFSPNGDGVNDTWNIYGLENFRAVTIKIFNRWGNVVQQNDGSNSVVWDGLRNGTPLPVATYYYVIDYLNREGESETLNGSVTIVR